MRNPKIKPWLDSGIRRFASHGSSGLNISEIATELNTAKSSFYHYFNTKEEYIEQLVEYCEEEGTLRIIKSSFLEDNGNENMKKLFTNIFYTNFIFENFLIQMRAASNENSYFKKKVIETDKLRLSFLLAMLTKSGYSTEDALIKARHIYRYFIGILVTWNFIEPTDEEKENVMEDFITLFEFE